MGLKPALPQPIGAGHIWSTGGQNPLTFRKAGLALPWREHDLILHGLLQHQVVLLGVNDVQDGSLALRQIDAGIRQPDGMKVRAYQILIPQV